MENTAKNFALQLGSLISLYISIGALISLLLSIITIIYPDTAQMPYEYTSATGSIRYTIAMLVVFFPTYLVLTRLVNTIRRRESGVYLTLTKWLIYISLLIGGGVLLGDIVAILLGFLNGELTIRFILKALAVFVVVGSAFLYYIADARGYWQKDEQKSILYGAVVSILVIVSIVFGYTKIETPSEVREMNIDQAQLNDLQMIQSYIESYALVNEKLPTTLGDAYGGLPIPVAEERSPYTYEVTTGSNFKLCAEFAFATAQGDRTPYPTTMMTEPMMVKNGYNWDHSAGMWCFERAINTVK